MNVFDIEDLGGGQKKAFVARPRDCTMCRECIREGDWSDKIKLEVRQQDRGAKGGGPLTRVVGSAVSCCQRVADHFIFSIESVGSMAPDDILREVGREGGRATGRPVEEEGGRAGRSHLRRACPFMGVWCMYGQAIKVLRRKAKSFLGAIKEAGE